MSPRRRPVQRDQRVLERRVRPSKPAVQARHLKEPLFDDLRLGRQTYLTVPELRQYGGFKSKNATYLFLSRYRARVPSYRRGGTVVVLRREYDAFVQSSHAGSVATAAHAAKGDTWSR